MFVLNIQVQTLQLVLPWYRWDTSSQIPCTMKTCLLLSWDHTILNIFDRIKFQSTKGWSHWINIYPNSIWLESQGCTWVFFFYFKHFILYWSSNVVVVSGEQWRALAIHVQYVYSPQSALPARLAHNTEFLVLYSRSLLVIHFELSLFLIILTWIIEQRTF